MIGKESDVGIIQLGYVGFGIEYGCGARLIDDATWWFPTYEVANNWGHHRVPRADAAKAETRAAATERRTNGQGQGSAAPVSTRGQQRR